MRIFLAAYMKNPDCNYYYGSVLYIVIEALLVIREKV
jgi:hypothetical protein